MAFVAKGQTVEITGTNTTTIPITLASVTRGVLVVCVAIRNSTGGAFRSVSSAVWNTSENGTVAKDQDSTTGTRFTTSEQWVIKNPTSGSHNLVVTLDGTPDRWCVWYLHYDEIDQTDTVNATAGKSFTDAEGNPWTQSITPTVDNAYIITSLYNAVDIDGTGSNGETLAAVISANSADDKPITVYKTAGTAGAVTTGVQVAAGHTDEAAMTSIALKPYVAVVPVVMSGLSVWLDDVNKTRQIVANSLRISNILTNKRDICEFNIATHAGDTYMPRHGEEVEVYDDDEKIFAGLVVTVESTPNAYATVFHKVTCHDYTRLLDKRLVPDTFENKTVEEILTTLKNSYFPEGFTINNVVAPITIKYISFNYKPLARCIEELAKLINYDWYVDYDKDVHFFAKESMVAPFNLADDTGTYRYNTLVIRKDNSQIRNSIYVRGGEYLGSQLTTDILTNGTDAFYPLPYKFADFGAHLTGEILNLGIDNIDHEDNHDALYNFQEKIIKFKEADKPSANKTLLVSGKPYLPVIVKYKSSSDIAAMASAESNPTLTSDGVYEYLIEDKSINSKEGARQRARAEILAYATTLSEGEFITERSGLRAGQAIDIVSSSRGINETFIINKVVITQFSASTLLYNVSLITTRTNDLIDVLQRLLLESTKKLEINPNETVDTIYELIDTAAFSDSSPTVSMSAPNTVYRYNSNAYYGYATYG